jgi:protein-S-isoprenylcysteine O-methyltransferase Ste14
MLQLKNELFRYTSYAWIVLICYWFYASKRVKITIQKEPWKDRLLYLVLMISAFEAIYYPVAGSNFLTVSILPPAKWIVVAGACIAVAGITFAIAGRYTLGKNWSAVVTIKKEHELVTKGVYRISRHPIYTGMLAGITGAAIIQGEVRGIIAILLFAAAAQIKIRTEEKFMRMIFKEYEEYSRQTKKLIPFIY